jgi:hypothetical protein
VVEVVVASALLLAALAIALAGLDSQSRTSAYATQRSQSLDDLRIMSTEFSKDIRAAAGATAANSSDLTVRTYVGGSLTTVRWRAFENRLERVAGSATRHPGRLQLRTRHRRPDEHPSCPAHPQHRAGPPLPAGDRRDRGGDAQCLSSCAGAAAPNPMTASP